MRQLKGNKIRAVLLLLVSQLAFSCTIPFLAYAEDEEEFTSIGVVGKMIGFLFPVFRAAGVILLAFGLGQLVLAAKEEAAEPKVKAVTLIIIGICLVTIRSLTSGLFSVLGVKGDIF